MQVASTMEKHWRTVGSWVTSSHNNNLLSAMSLRRMLPRALAISRDILWVRLGIVFLNTHTLKSQTDGIKARFCSALGGRNS